MTHTTNGAGGSESPAPYKQAGRPEAMVAQFRASERSRRSRRWARRELDALLDLPNPPAVALDYDLCGLTLGWPERVAAGRALLAQERAA
jgi:hypothetical protein